jgi:WD40 repeat protein
MTDIEITGGMVESGRVELKSGELLVIAANEKKLQFRHQETRHVIQASASSLQGSQIIQLVTRVDARCGTRLLTGGNRVREWDATTWKQVGDPWTGHTDHINAIAIHPAGTLVASTSSDSHTRLWQLSDRQTIAVFKHSLTNSCVTFSMDGNHIFSGGSDKMIPEWTVPQGIHPKACFHL